jgi:putative acetyltransferase
MADIIFRKFQPGDETAFRELNEKWVRQYFEMEAKDHEVLNDPLRYVIQPGGEVIMAIGDGAAVGCCALIKMEGGIFEVAKMTTDENFRGHGIGEGLLRAVIRFARQMGATGLYLETNSKLANAIRLYERTGFTHVPPERVHASPYARSNVSMELFFQ